jgi:hypothetical protein
MPPPDHPVTPSRAAARRVAPPRPGDVRQALQAIGLVALVVAYNILVYYLVVVYLAKLVGGQPTFLAFIMFLSVALSFAVILRVALGEAVDPANIQNPLLKQIGVTPILMIVACLGALLLSFTPLSGKILAAVGPEFMLAKIGITCVTKDENKTPEAIRLVTLISADDEQYIAKVKTFLDAEMAKNDGKEGFSLTWINHNRSDSLYNVLQQYAHSSAKGSEVLTSQLRTDNKWLAYAEPLNDPQNTTVVLVPTIFDKNHRTSFYAVLTEAAEAPAGRGIAPLLAATAGGGRALPLFQVEIAPRVLSNLLQTTEFNVEVFTDHICWHVAPGGS